jgi:hypothetical protein
VARYNKKVISSEFEVEDLFLYKANVSQKTRTETYIPETFLNKSIPQTWNATKLQKY